MGHDVKSDGGDFQRSLAGEPVPSAEPKHLCLDRLRRKALWPHRAVAGRLVSDPDAVLAKAAANLERLRQIHPHGMALIWLDRWQTVLDAGVEAVLDTLTSRAPDAVELRQNSPFAGVLPEAERRTVLSAFADRWRDEHAA